MIKWIIFGAGLAFVAVLWILGTASEAQRERDQAAASRAREDQLKRSP